MSKSSLVQVEVPAYIGNYTIGRNGRKIEAITIHHMAGRLTAEKCGEIFRTIGRNGSSHYGIGYDGKIAQYVDESNTAWTNSNWDSNCKSVTIETSDNDSSWYVNDVTLNSLIKLVADIAKRNNLGKLVKGKNLTWHSMFTNTSCPGQYLLSKMDYIANEANKINGYGTSASGTSVNVYYRVKTKKHGWLAEVKNLNDYAGWENSPITDIAIKVDRGSVKYRVAPKGKDFLPWVTGYNINDYVNGFAGNGTPIDRIQIYYYTPSNVRPYKKAKYRVDNLPWQTDTDVNSSMEGFAGIRGKAITKLEINIE